MERSVTGESRAANTPLKAFKGAGQTPSGGLCLQVQLQSPKYEGRIWMAAGTVHLGNRAEVVWHGMKWHGVAGMA